MADDGSVLCQDGGSGQIVPAPLLQSIKLALQEQASSSPSMALAARCSVLWEACMFASMLNSVVGAAATAQMPSVLQISCTRYHDVEVLSSESAYVSRVTSD